MITKNMVKMLYDYVLEMAEIKSDGTKEDCYMYAGMIFAYGELLGYDTKRMVKDCDVFINLDVKK